MYRSNAEAFSAQPRLALVTNTISDAASDIFHFFIVFMAIFLCFAARGGGRANF